MQDSRVAVVGGGWAGIAAAVELTSAGCPVTLFEAGRRLGGRARGIGLDGRELDNGQHILLGAYRDTLALMRRVGAVPDQLLRRLPLEIHDNAGFRLRLPRLPAPLNLAWGLLSARGVGWREKLATAWWMDKLKRAGFRLSGDCTVDEWLDNAGQTGVLRRQLWSPLCLAALNTPPERASAQVFANTLRDSLGSPRRGDTDLLLPRGTLSQVLPEPAASWLRDRGVEMRCSTRVRSIRAADQLVLLDGEPYAGAVIATAPQHASALLSEADHDEWTFEPIATIYLACDRSPGLPFPMVGLQGGIGQWVIDRGDGILACVLSGHGGWGSMDDGELVDRLAAELALSPKPRWHRVVREKRATFSCHPGLRRPDPAFHARLFRAGDYTWAEYPGTLEGAVRSGFRAARLLLQAIGR